MQLGSLLPTDFRRVWAVPVTAEGAARKDASGNMGGRLRAGFQTVGIKTVLRTGAMLEGLFLGADVTQLLLPGVFAAHSTPKIPIFRCKTSLKPPIYLVPKLPRAARRWLTSRRRASYSLQSLKSFPSRPAAPQGWVLPAHGNNIEFPRGCGSLAASVKGCFPP